MEQKATKRTKGERSGNSRPRFNPGGSSGGVMNGVTRDRLALLALCFICLLYSNVTSAQQPKRKKYETMIDSLANHNRRPGINYLGQPSFPRSYDWKEARRVRTLYLQLATNDSEALWEEFLKHLDDDRYSLTMGLGDGVASNYSVGSLCFRLAYKRLELAFYDDLPKQDEGRPLMPDLSILDDLAAWRKERQAKSLYELQIDACQLASDKLMREPDLSAAEKREVRGKISRRIAALQKAKKSVFWKPSSFDAYEWYDTDEARRIRDKARRESQRDAAHTRNEQPRRKVTSWCGGSVPPPWQRLCSPSP